MYGLLIYLISGVIIAQVFRMEYWISRFFSLLALCLISFILSFFFPFKPVFYSVFFVFLVLGLIQLKRKGFNFDYRSETAFLLTFLFFLFLRSLAPEAFGAEKLMDFAFLNTVLEAERFHPPDPFFAHGTLNFYYYFGYVIGAGITLMSFVPLEIGFNVAIATIPAYFLMLGYGLLRELAGKDNGNVNGGLIVGTIFIACSGNLYAVYELITDFVKGKLPTFLFYWNATRVIDDITYGKTINEFPYFSFIHADYHAHFVALPIKLLALILLWRYFKKDVSYGFYLIPIIFILFATNSWDAPVFLFITILAFIYRYKSIRDKNELLKGGVIVFVSILSILALYSTMETPSARPFLTGERTDIWQFILFFGILIFLDYLYFKDSFEEGFKGSISYRLGLVSVVAGIVGFFVSPIMLLIVPLLVLSFRKYLKGDFGSMLILSASLLILACEFVAIESRLNTFFKFYLASWVLLSIPAAVVVVEALKSEDKMNKMNKTRYFVIALLILSFVYPLIATPMKYHKAEFSLDSSRFIKEISIDDYNAIQFLKGKRGIIIESAEGCYSYEGRVSAFTANPTLVAWSCHEVQWRANPDELARRMAEVRAIYKSKDCEVIREIVKRYNVSYIFLGYQERKDYGVSSLRCFKEVYRSGKTIVYTTR